MIKLLSKTETEVKLNLKLSAEEWNNYINEAYEATKGKFNVAGFRKGKVPKNVIEKTYGPSIFYDEAINKAINKEYGAYLMENKEIEPYTQPELAVKQVNSEGFETEISVALAPKCTLGKYKGLGLKVKANTIKDSEVEAALKQEQEKLARFDTTKAASRNGDIVNINFEGFMDGVAFEGGKAEKFDLELGSHQFIEGFEEQLVGLKAGEEKDVVVTFPADYHAENLANKKATFKCKVNEVKAKVLPELNDKFASDVSEFNTLEEYKNSIKEQLLHDKEHHAAHELEDEIVDKIVEGSRFSIAPVVIEEEYEHHLEDVKNRIREQTGLDVATYCKYVHVDEEKFNADRKAESEKMIKMRLALTEIINAEKFSVEKEDIINALREHNANMTAEAAEKYFGKLDAERKNMVANDAMMHKILHFLVEVNTTTTAGTEAKPSEAKKPTAAKSAPAAKKPATTTAKKSTTASAKKTSAKE